MHPMPVPPKSEPRSAGLRLLGLARQATAAAEAVLRDARAAVGARVQVDGHTVARLFDREQRATHGLAWIATYAEAIRQLGDYAQRAHDAGVLGETEELIVELGLGEYLAQLLGGIPMSQGEVVRPADIGLSVATVAEALAGPLEGLMSGNMERRARLVALMVENTQATVGDCGLDEMLAAARDEMR